MKGVPLVDIRAGRHQELHHRHLLLQHGVDEGRLADLEGGQCGHGIEESTLNTPMPASWDGDLCLHLVGGPGVCSVLQQSLRDGRQPVHGGEVQRTLATNQR